MSDVDWEWGYQQALDEMAGVILPEGIAIVWSKIPLIRMGAVERHNERVKQIWDKKLDATGNGVAQSNQSNETV